MNENLCLGFTHCIWVESFEIIPNRTTTVKKWNSGFLDDMQSVGGRR